MARKPETWEIAGRPVSISNPDKVYFPEPGYTKGDLVRYYVAVGDAHQAHVKRLADIRPHRLIEIEHFFQTYKLLEDKTVQVIGWQDVDRAYEELEADRRRLAG